MNFKHHTCPKSAIWHYWCHEHETVTNSFYLFLNH